MFKTTLFSLKYIQVTKLQRYKQMKIKEFRLVLRLSIASVSANSV